MLLTAVAPAAAAQWASAGRLLSSREFHPATALPDGRVLVSGGFSFSGILASAELFHPATRRWQNTFPMSFGRFAHTSTLLTDGRALVADGENLDEGYVAAAEGLRSRDGGVAACGTAAARAGQPHRVAAPRTGGCSWRAGWPGGTPSCAAPRSAKPGDEHVVGMPPRCASPASTTPPRRCPDGRVLVTGGDRGEDDFQRSAEI